MLIEFQIILFILAAVPAVCHICLTWRITNNHIKLRCKTSNLRFKVLFYDSNFREYGFCYSLFKESFCQTHYQSGSITQNSQTNVTELTIPSKSEFENNVWTCRHGVNYEEATIGIGTNYEKDFIGPEIRTNQTWPFEEGSVVELTCIAWMKEHDVTLSWDCMNITADSQLNMNCTQMSSVLLYVTNIEDNGRICRCYAKTELSVFSTSVKLDIHRKVALNVQNQFQCNNEDSVQMECKVSGNPVSFGFDSWIHSLNGIVIRHIQGQSYGHRSVINIQSCLLFDTETYACRIWLADNNDRKWIQRTSELIVKGPPFIVDTKTNTMPVLSLSVSFISFPEPILCEWYLKDTRLRNMSEFNHNTTKDTLTVQIYGISVLMQGYSSSLTIQGVIGMDTTFAVLLFNELGNSSHSFDLKDTKDTTFPFNLVQWTVVSTGFIILVMVTCSFLIVQNRGQKHNRIWLSENADSNIYYAAPQIDIEARIYNEILQTSEELEIIHDYIEIESITVENEQKSLENSSSDYVEMQ